MWNEAKCNYCGDCMVECQYTDYGSAWTTGLALKMKDSLLQAGFPVFMSIQGAAVALGKYFNYHEGKSNIL